jgi:hypothetical protein
MLGALVSQYSMRRNSASPDAFDVRILDTADHPFLAAREGQPYLRDGATRPWHQDDLQSFTPLRFQPPAALGYQGRALVTDPDVFAVGDVHELLTRDMQGKAILCRLRSGSKGRAGLLASSVMLLDCEKLRHWRCEEQFGEMFEMRRDYSDWIGLQLEPRESIGLFEDEWNDFDRLTPATKLIHNTKRYTQPWKAGLPIDFIPAEKTRSFPPLGWFRRARRAVLGPYTLLGRYRRHPDPAQEAFFFGLLRECLETGVVSEQRLRDEMQRNHLRHDAFELLEKTPPLAA